MNFSERLKECMRDAELRPMDVERKTGIHHTIICNLLLGKHLPSFNVLIKLLYFFDCSADYLLGISEIPTDEKLFPVPQFSERLKDILKEKKISQEKLKRELPVSGSVLYYWISGKRLPLPDNLIKLSKYFDCSVDYLIGRIR